MRLKLRAIVSDADFRKNEATLYEEFKASRSYPGKLRANECFLFLSKSRNQLLWFFSDVRMTDGWTKQIAVYDSRRWRIKSGTWHPFMLANYAADVGIELVGIKRFEEIHDERRRR